MPYKKHHSLLPGICGVFLIATLAFLSQGPHMLTDSDPFWHLAAGDWILSHHELPQHDPWAFTSGDYPWLNISWAWDTLFSFIHSHWGWYGAEAANALILGLTVALVYAACAAACNDGIASFLAAFFVLTMVSPALRPLQISHLMTALWMFILSSAARGQLRRYWLTLLPLTMIFWVNTHGGFLIGFVLLFAFAMEALWRRNRSLLYPLIAVSVASALAALINPYGIGIIEAVFNTLGTTGKHILNEWQPFSFSFNMLSSYFYVPLFVLLVFRRNVLVSRAERGLSYFWLLLGLMSIRSLGIFAIVSAPLLACRMKELLAPKHTPGASAMAIRQWAEAFFSRPTVAGLAVLFCAGFILWLPSPMAERRMNIDQSSIPSLKPEEAFLKANYPDARILIHFDLGGIVEYETQGGIRTFMDGRTETAFPEQVMKDYIDFEYAGTGWERIFDRYHIDGVMIPKGSPPYIMARPQLLDRFLHRAGWRKVFEGPTALVFMRSG